MGNEQTQFKPKEAHWNWKGGISSDKKAYMKPYLKNYYEEHKMQIKMNIQTEEYKNKKQEWNKNYSKKHSERLSEKAKIYYLGNKQRISIAHKTPAGKYAEYKRGAKKRGLVFAVSFDEYTALCWGAKCHYCGEENETHGMDRMDNSKGYVLENLISCCQICNWMKRDLGLNDFIAHCHKIIMNSGGNCGLNL